MFIYAYVFALVSGGVLLAASVLLGGNHDSDADADGAHDFSKDFGKDFGKDFAKDFDKDASHGELGGLFGVLASMRFWTFFLTFFGLTGLVLEGLGLTANVWVARGLAIAVGYLSGWATVRVIQRLAADQSSVVPSVSDYVGKSGAVLVRIAPGGVGKVRIELKGTTVDVLAVCEDGVLERGDHALIVELRDTQALVTKIEGKPNLLDA